MNLSPRSLRIVIPALVILAAILFFWNRSGSSEEPTRASAAATKVTKDAIPLRKRERVSPTTLAPGSIRGTVKDEAGKAIAGARVCAYGWSKDLSGEDTRIPTCAIADGTGAYVLSGLVPATYRPAASAASFKPGRYTTPDEDDDENVKIEAGQAVTGIDIALKSGGVQVQGIVLDIGGGPIAGALVSASSGGWWSSGAGAMDLADEEGRFTLWVAPGSIRVSARSEGYTDGDSEAMAPGETVEIFLTPEAALAGRVVEAGGDTPVARALVTVGDLGVRYSFPGGGSENSNGSAFTDEDGRFRITGLRPGRYKPNASVAGAYGEARESVMLGLGETAEGVIIEVHPAYIVTGTVFIGDDEKTPCEKGNVSLAKGGGWEGRHWGSIEDGGLVEIAPVLPGSYKVQVRCEGYLGADEYEDIEIASADVEGVAWHVGIGAGIVGKVTLSSGEPVADATVRVEGVTADDPRAQQPNAWETTDDTGAYEAQGLAKGRARVNVVAAGFPDLDEPIEVTLEKGKTARVDITLPESGTIIGRVVERGGKPVPGVQIQTTRIDRSDDSWSWFGGSRSVDDGSFEIKGVKPGKYRVTASRDSWGGESLRAPGASDDDVGGVVVEVKAGQRAEANLEVEALSGVITGQVLGADGKPVTDAYVSATRESERAGAAAGRARHSVRWSWNRRPTLTDMSGEFELTDLSEGNYTIRAYRRGGGEALAEGIAVGKSVTMTIASTGSIEGRVIAKIAPPIFTITVNDKSAGFSRSERFFRTEGQWTMRGLPPGSFNVSVASDSGSAETDVPLASGEHRQGVQLELASNADLTGTIVDKVTGEPVPGIMVMGRPASGGGNMAFAMDDERSNISDASGKFKVKDAPTGKLMIQAFPMDWEESEYSFAGRVINVSGDMDIGKLEIMKKRTAKGDAAGDLGFTLVELAPDVDFDAIKHVVALVRPGGPAADTGLKVGDTIVTVDGHDVVTDPFSYWSLTSVPPGTKLSLGLEDGETIEIEAAAPQE